MKDAKEGMSGRAKDNTLRLPKHKGIRFILHLDWKVRPNMKARLESEANQVPILRNAKVEEYFLGWQRPHATCYCCKPKDYKLHVAAVLSVDELCTLVTRTLGAAL